MISAQRALVCAILCSACAAGPAVFAAKKAPPTEKGTYTDWNHSTLDKLEILQTPTFANATRIVVLPLDTAGTPLPPEKDAKALAAVRNVLAAASEVFVAGIKQTVGDRLEVVTATEPPSGEAAQGVVLVRAALSELNPGSRSARFWVGMGAGLTRAEIKGEILDGATGTLLLRFTQARAGARNAGTEKLLTENVREVGTDVGTTILVFKDPGKAR